MLRAIRRASDSLPASVPKEWGTAYTSGLASTGGLSLRSKPQTIKDLRKAHVAGDRLGAAGALRSHAVLITAHLVVASRRSDGRTWWFDARLRYHRHDR